MKNPFQRNDHKLLIAGIAVGTAAAGTAAYLFFSNHGNELREKLSSRVANLFTRKPEQQPVHETPAYLQHEGAKPKTDREQLLKGEILHHPENTSEEQHSS